jgi:hypothetical protein
MTLETSFSRLAVRTVHIREVLGSTPRAPNFSPFVYSPASMSNVVPADVNRGPNGVSAWICTKPSGRDLERAVRQAAAEISQDDAQLVNQLTCSRISGCR